MLSQKKKKEFTKHKHEAINVIFKEYVCGNIIPCSVFTWIWCFTTLLEFLHFAVRGIDG